MKIIFLDVDGVLNNRVSMQRHKQTGTIYNVDPACVERLNRIFLEAHGGVYCVLSSTWRLNWPIAAFQKFLEAHGFVGWVIDKTPRTGEERGAEIAIYLNQCRERGYPVESFVILDDDSDMGPLLPFLVKTSTEDGLQDEHINQAAAILNVCEDCEKASNRICAQDAGQLLECLDCRRAGDKS